MASEMEKLKEQLAAANRSNKVAAEYGLHLLEENKSLKTELQKQKSDYEKNNEKLQQQIYSLTGKLDTKERDLVHYCGELEASKEMYDSLVAKLSSTEDDLQHQIAVLEKRKVQQEMDSLEKDSTIGQLRKQVQDLELQNQEVNERVQASFAELTDSFEQNILNENQRLHGERSELEKRLLDLEKEVEFLKKQETVLKTVHHELEEELASRKKELSDCRLQKQEAWEENEELRLELESLKIGQFDVKKRGNSLFAEVEDNRKTLENEVKTLRSENIALIEKEKVNQQTIRKMKYEMTLLMSMSDQRIDANYIQKLSADLSQARGEIAELTLKLKSSLEKQKLQDSSKVQSPVPNMSTYNEEGYGFLKTLISERDHQNETLKRELESMRLVKTSLNNRIVQAEKQLFQADKRNDSMKTEMMKLKLELEDCKKKTSTMQTKMSKPAIKVEKIPGFQESASLPSKEEHPDIVLGVEVGDKENQVKANHENVKQVRPKECERKISKKVSFDVPDSQAVEKTEKLVRVIGKKADTPCVLISSENASKPDECAQQ